MVIGHSTFGHDNAELVGVWHAPATDIKSFKTFNETFNELQLKAQSQLKLIKFKQRVCLFAAYGTARGMFL